jgi:hypothetical protein
LNTPVLVLPSEALAITLFITGEEEKELYTPHDDEFVPPEALALTFVIVGDEDPLSTPVLNSVPPEALAITSVIVGDEE